MCLIESLLDRHRGFVPELNLYFHARAYLKQEIVDGFSVYRSAPRLSTKDGELVFSSSYSGHRCNICHTTNARAVMSQVVQFPSPCAYKRQWNFCEGFSWPSGTALKPCLTFQIFACREVLSTMRGILEFSQCHSSD